MVLIDSSTMLPPRRAGEPRAPKNAARRETAGVGLLRTTRFVLFEEKCRLFYAQLRYRSGTA